MTETKSMNTVYLHANLDGFTQFVYKIPTGTELEIHNCRILVFGDPSAAASTLLYFNSSQV